MTGAAALLGVLEVAVVVAVLRVWGHPIEALPHPFGGARPGAIPRGRHEKEV